MIATGGTVHGKLELLDLSNLWTVGLAMVIIDDISLVLFNTDI